MALLDVGGLRLEVAVEGERAATPLLLLHGFTGAGEELLACARRLDVPRRSIAVDLIGHGASDAPSDPACYAFDRAIADLVRVLDRLEATRVDLWGYSLGGRLALAFALAAPERVRRLVLESASPGIADEVERAARRREDAALADAIEADGISAFVDRWEAQPLFAGAPAHAELRSRRLGQRPHGLANALRGLGAGTQPSLWPRLHMLRCPTLLLTGVRDAKFDAMARQMQPLFPFAVHASITDSGHAPHRERPLEAAAAITDFLRSP